MTKQSPQTMVRFKLCACSWKQSHPLKTTHFAALWNDKVFYRQVHVYPLACFLKRLFLLSSTVMGKLLKNAQNAFDRSGANLVVSHACVSQCESKPNKYKNAIIQVNNAAVTAAAAASHHSDSSLLISQTDCTACSLVACVWHSTGSVSA